MSTLPRNQTALKQLKWMANKHAVTTANETVKFIIKHSNQVKKQGSILYRLSITKKLQKPHKITLLLKFYLQSFQ